MCLQLLLSQYSGLKDVIVQTAMAGRVASELEPLIGWFANGAAVRTKLDGGHGPRSRPSLRDCIVTSHTVKLLQRACSPHLY